MTDPFRLPMEIRDVEPSQRTIVGVVVPYDEVSYLSPNPGGERIRRGAFEKSIRQRGGRIPLFRNHDHGLKLGVSRSFVEETSGLIGEFAVLEGRHGDDLLEDVRAGHLDGLSVAFQPLNAPRRRDGVVEVREARLFEVSVVALAAYAGAGLLAVRSAQDLDALLAPFVARPDVNLAPIPPIVGRSPRR